MQGNSLPWLRADVRFMQLGILAMSVCDAVCFAALFAVLGAFVGAHSDQFWAWALTSFSFSASLGDLVLLACCRAVVLGGWYGVRRGTRSLGVAVVVALVSVGYAVAKAAAFRYGAQPRGLRAGETWGSGLAESARGLEIALVVFGVVVPAAELALLWKLLLRIARVQLLLETPSLLGARSSSINTGPYGETMGVASARISQASAGQGKSKRRKKRRKKRGVATGSRMHAPAAAAARLNTNASQPTPVRTDGRRAPRHELADFSSAGGQSGDGEPAMPGELVPVGGAERPSASAIIQGFVPGVVAELRASGRAREVAREARVALARWMSDDGWSGGTASRTDSRLVVWGHPRSAYMFRAQMPIAATPAKVLALWCNDEARLDWDSSLKDYRALGSVDEDVDLVWMEWALPWPVGSRDFVALRSHEPLEGGACMCTIVSVNVPAKDSKISFSAVRAQLAMYGLHLAPSVDDPTTSVATLMCVPDLGEHPPQAIVPLFRPDGALPGVLTSLAQFVDSGTVVPRTTLSAMTPFFSYTEAVVTPDKRVGGAEAGSVSFERAAPPSVNGTRAAPAKYAELANEALRRMRQVVDETPWSQDVSTDVDGRNEVFRGHHGELACVRSVATTSVGIDEVERVLTQPQARLAWDTGATGMHELRHFADSMSVMWMERRMPWPASSRDFVFLQAVLAAKHGSAARAVVLASLDEDFTLPEAYASDLPDRVRGKFLPGGGFLLEPLGSGGGDGTRITVVSAVDLNFKGKQGRQWSGKIPNPSLAALVARHVEGE
ncbi:uncharacterized protein AMSG_08745 [Thecamonas trahens ATCC 50062]|uniref:START domain-containing protein n=1 Tax=Thecamonas trahens ATCC 50062 TaxID=461836 RepID=A0A0L0DLS3_THETB|nr:hypothetical protein AMSG_08745 [Thecamonas trahens ATCC 50062]KNC53257.1 hypothetical protein AMSG_08745 [Thecamonas trahens ATCC 50062]|eukprot:XP_013754521.1 hypothetical protein AMSG_08745 [Thecamonas trahens ATCC 50062]